MSSGEPEKLIRQAETEGFASNICAWIKGIYATVMNNGVKDVIAVTGGDCSNTVALAEVLSHKGIRIITFDYPLSRDRDFLRHQMEGLRRTLSATWDDIKKVKQRLDGIREKLRELDRLTFEGGVVAGLENHIYLLSSSDFNSDPDAFEKGLDGFLREAGNRKPLGDTIRLGYLGVPPIFTRFYETIESYGARVVFNEVQRQFSLPYNEDDIVDLYLKYTYPYKIEARIEDIKRAIAERDLDGLIHYTQTFCFRQIYDTILKERLPVPILTLEGDRPGHIDGRTALRLETFIEMLKNQRPVSFR
jgi:benzoyl-CoA reductase/2-hydroxyglutaryl-CoA dehydratase subunit BcrC/BadD/HgdB